VEIISRWMMIVSKVLHIHTNTTKDSHMYIVKFRMHSGNIKITIICEILEVSVSVYFVSDGQIIQPVTCTGRYLPLLTGLWLCASR
jgi:hypothetical protein